ncbi:ABC transporter permease subunit [Candidatus Methylocalor cossyra]|uniref:Spermidine preferential ABC transporter membrane subunit PotB n=1 Tax=Candidatus Methylocalor cossyra TaxID=3108543 RepID=A0ABM9NFR0_9GAMM
MPPIKPFKLAEIGLLPLWLGMFTLLPLVLVLGASLLRRDEAGLIDPVPTGENYARLLDPIYLKIFGHSLSLALLATGLCLLAGYPFAYFLSQVRPGWRPLLLTLVVVPFWTNSLVRTYAIRGLLAAQGPLNKALLSLGLIDEPIRLLYATPAVVIGLAYVLLPFMILPLYSSFEKLDRRLVEAAADLGAGRAATFWHVIVPLTAPGIAAGSLLVFLPALGMFYVADVLGGARDLLLGNFLKDQFLDARDWPFGAAASVAVIALLFLFLAIHGLSRRRLGGGGADG